MDGLLIEDWFRTYGDDVYNYLYYCIRSDDVEDLVQETFLRALRGIHAFREQSSPKTWLFAIARRVALDHQRKRVRRPELFWRMGDVKSDTDGPEAVVERNEAMSEVLKCLNRAKPGYRDVVVLRIVMEVSTADTSKILGWSESRVRVTLHRALREIRSAIQPPIQPPIGGNLDVPNAE